MPLPRTGDPVPPALAAPSRAGQVCLYHVWSISCPACKSNMQHLQALCDKYAGQGLQTVAIHVPRGESEQDAATVRAVATEIGVTETLILDTTTPFPTRSV